jgi:lysophospholipase L1-like esterase
VYAVTSAVYSGRRRAGSWGPPNMLAYAKRFGFFGADVVAIVLSSHDAKDVPTFAPLGPDFPTERPLSAILELATRYGRRFIGNGTAAPVTAMPSGDPAVALGAMCDLIAAARRAAAAVVVVQHQTPSELADGPLAEHAATRERAVACGADVIDLGPAFAAAQREGRQVYRDDIHPTVAGQQVIAASLRDALVTDLAR